ncbi:MAG: hypothetical protein KDE19_22135, partial [Caldilineaceae bacterium]|nr:hypothetical protein [Caldilineaceae bacterium]
MNLFRPSISTFIRLFILVAIVLFFVTLLPGQWHSAIFSTVHAQSGPTITVMPDLTAGVGTQV